MKTAQLSSTTLLYPQRSLSVWVEAFLPSPLVFWVLLPPHTPTCNSQECHHTSLLISHLSRKRTRSHPCRVMFTYSTLKKRNAFTFYGGHYHWNYSAVPDIIHGISSFCGYGLSCHAAAEEQKSKCTHGSVEVFESLLPDPDSDNTLSQTELRHECGSNRRSFV